MVYSSWDCVGGLEDNQQVGITLLAASKINVTWYFWKHPRLGDPIDNETGPEENPTQKRSRRRDCTEIRKGRIPGQSQKMCVHPHL